MKKIANLTGISASSPIGFLAALGLTRILSSDFGKDVRLCWKKGHVVIDGVGCSDILEILEKHMKERVKSPEFNWTDSLRKVSPELYRRQCERMKNDDRALGFMAAWGTDTVLKDGCMSETRFDMTSGQQKLLKSLRAMVVKIKREHFASALLGGPYEAQSSFGLDPVAVRSHAHESEAPTNSDPPGKKGLIWLAYESIPLHPLIPTASGKPSTLGWSDYPKAGYVWPIWRGFLNLKEIALLRAYPLDMLYDRPEIAEVWYARYGKNGKYGMLYPAKREH